MISKFFDGFSDLVAGQLIDTRKGKLGHCIPVLAKWTIPMALSVVLIFLVPENNLILQIIFILLLTTCLTLFFIHIFVWHTLHCQHMLQMILLSVLKC